MWGEEEEATETQKTQNLKSATFVHCIMNMVWDTGSKKAKNRNQETQKQHELRLRVCPLPPTEDGPKQNHLSVTPMFLSLILQPKKAQTAWFVRFCKVCCFFLLSWRWSEDCFFFHLIRGQIYAFLWCVCPWLACGGTLQNSYFVPPSWPLWTLCGGGWSRLSSLQASFGPFRIFWMISERICHISASVSIFLHAPPESRAGWLKQAFRAVKWPRNHKETFQETLKSHRDFDVQHKLFFFFP